MTNPRDHRILVFSDFQNRVITSSLTLLCCIALGVGVVVLMGLLLHGQAGNGKTHLAVAAMMEIHERFGVPAVFDVLPPFLAKSCQTP